MKKAELWKPSESEAVMGWNAVEDPKTVHNLGPSQAGSKQTFEDASDASAKPTDRDYYCHRLVKGVLLSLTWKRTAPTFLVALVKHVKCRGYSHSSFPLGREAGEVAALLGLGDPETMVEAASLIFDVRLSQAILFTAPYRMPTKLVDPYEPIREDQDN